MRWGLDVDGGWRGCEEGGFGEGEYKAWGRAGPPPWGAASSLEGRGTWRWKLSLWPRARLLASAQMTAHTERCGYSTVPQWLQ